MTGIIGLPLNSDEAFLLFICLEDRFEWYMGRFFKAKDDIDEDIERRFMQTTLSMLKKLATLNPDWKESVDSYEIDFFNATEAGEKPTWIQ